MKNIIYSKYSNERADWFKIRTDILENENGQKYVQKIALTKEANNHIDNIYEHYKNLSQLYANTKLSINKCFKIKNNKLEFEYIEGRTLEEELDELLVKKDFINLVERIKDFINVIKSVSQNDSFKVTEDFIKVFGNVNLPVSLKASSINDIDLVFHNIIVKDENWNVIDYEWTFNFLIPTNFIIYRTLHYFTINSSRTSIIKDLNLNKIFNITNEEIGQYKCMEENFQRYILGNILISSFNYLYNKFSGSNLYLDKLISYKKMDEDKKFIQIFYDYGEGIKEENSYYLKLDSTKDSVIKFEIPVKYGLKNLRIDPASESCLVKIENILIESQEYAQANFVTNGNFINQNTIIYTTEDPQLTLYNFPEEIKNVLVEFEVKILPKDVAIQISKIISEKNLLIEKSRTLTEQLNEVKYQKDIETLALISQRKNEIERLSLQKEKEINILVSQKDEEINSLKIQKDEEINSLKIQKDEEINSLKIQKDEEINSLKIQKDEEINSLKIQKDEEINSLKSKFDNFIIEQENIIEENKKKINGLEEEYGNKKEHERKLEEELNHYKLHYQAAINQREDLKSQLAIVNEQYYTISNATCWKITKPLRISLYVMKKLLKSNKITYKFCRGVKCLKENGIKYTIKKIRLKIRNKRNIYKLNMSSLMAEEELKKQKDTKFNKNIKFSIIVPLYNTPQNFLQQMIESVINQTYANWELCMADGSDNDHNYIKKICTQYCKKDNRIKYKKLEKNLGISENTNRCIELSTGDYLGLLDHDDLLHPSALYENMIAITEKDADFIYTDENTFHNTPSDAFCPHFKPDFAIDNLRANNYICHFSVFSRLLLNEIGLFRKECDGSQDYDIILRLTEKAEHIVHIPKVLYYWRAHDNSVASDISAKPYVIESAKKAIRDHLKRVNLEGEVFNSSVISTYKINYNIIGNPLISILIPNKDHIEDLQKCINSILEKSTYNNYEIIIIENNSTDERTFNFYKELEKNKKIRVVRWNGKFNYSAINNFGFSYSKGEYIILLNNDVEIITDNWIEEMLMFAQRKDVGAVGAKLYYPDNTIQHAGIGIGILTLAGHYHKHFPRSHPGYMARLSYAQDVSAVTGACMMIPRNIFKEIKGLNESFEVAFNDIDLCMRIRQLNYLIIFTPYAELYHYESKSRGLDNTPEKRVRFVSEVTRFQEKWKKELDKGDPYYNPNLTLESEDFSIK